MNPNNFVFAVGWSAIAFTWIKINTIFSSSILNALKQKSTPSERFFIFSDDITDYHREVVEFLVIPDTSKTIIGVELTNDQVESLSDEDVEKYYKRCKALNDTYETSCEQK